MARTVKSGELRVLRADLEAKIKAEVEKVELTAEQRTAVQKMIADADKLKDQYELIERSDDAERELKASIQKNEKPKGDSEKSVLSDDAVERKAQTKAAFVDFLKRGKNDMSADNREILEAEKRVYTPLMVANPAAGYFVPIGFSYEFDEALRQFGGMFGACRNYPTDSGNPLLWPMVDDTSNVAVIVGEGQPFTGVNPTVTHVTLNAYKYGTMAQASLEQLEDSAFDIETWLRGEFAVRFGRGVNAALTNGSGVGQPNGLVTAVLASGNPQITLATDAGILYAELVDAIHSVDPAYRADPSCQFMFPDSTVRAIRLITDAYGHPIFQSDPTSALPDRILGFKFTVNQDLNSLAETTSPPQSPPGGTGVVGLFGAFNRYVIRKVNGLLVQRLNERYADLGLVGFLGWARYDGDLVTASDRAIVAINA